MGINMLQKINVAIKRSSRLKVWPIIVYVVYNTNDIWKVILYFYADDTNLFCQCKNMK